MLRPAGPGDLTRLLAIRDASGADALSDPAPIGGEMLGRLIDGGAVAVWEHGGDIAGFAAVDGATIHLLVDTVARGAGVGRTLLAEACARVKRAGRAAARLNLAPGSTAARHYRAAGWTAAKRREDAGLVLKKPL